MKILFFTENTHQGGLDSFLISLINHWPYPSDELVLIGNRNHPGLAAIRENLTQPCTVGSHNIMLDWELTSLFAGVPVLKLFERVARPLLRYPFFVFYIIRLMLLFRRGGFDRLMVVNGGYPAGYSNRAATIAWGLLDGKSRSIHNFHNTAVEPLWWEAWVEYVIDKLVDKYSARIVSTSNICAQTIRTRPALTSSKKISFIWNGTESPPQHTRGPKTLKQRLGIPSDGFVCAMLGSYEARKGHAFLFGALSEVLKSVPNVYLVTTGYGLPAEVQRVEKIVEQMGLGAHVRVEDFSIDKHDLYRETDVLVAGSQAFESFGLTLIEAMSHKVPVVATRVGGMPEVMGNDEAGFSVDKDRVDEFAEKITILLTDDKLRRKKGRDGYQRYLDTFTAKRMAADYAWLIRGDNEHPDKKHINDSVLELNFRG